jgi:hypothetical protein
VLRPSTLLTPRMGAKVANPYLTRE